MPLGASTMLPFPSQGHIGLIVRGKPSRDVAPSDNGHADVILPSGAPAGFFVHPDVERGFTLGLGVEGHVYGYAAYSSYRPWYVDLASARARNVVSGVLLIQVTPRESDRFLNAWQIMRARRGEFNFMIVGNNCATHAALAFSIAGLVNREIPGLDTPDNLFHALRARHASRCRDEYGYLGFLPRESALDQMDLQCDVGMDACDAVRGPPRRGRSVHGGGGGLPGLRPG